MPKSVLPDWWFLLFNDIQFGSNKVDIGDINKPLITICALDQFIESKMEEMKFYNTEFYEYE